MTDGQPFSLNVLDAVDLIHRALRKLEKLDDAEQPDEHVMSCVDSILSMTIHQFRNKYIQYRPEQRGDYDTLVKFVS